MNKHDKDNLKFILALKPQDFQNWYESLTEDDAMYAMELVSMARTELETQVAELFDKVEDCSDAKNVLGKFTLKGMV
jgi:hypothetical protein